MYQYQSFVKRFHDGKISFHFRDRRDSTTNSINAYVRRIYASSRKMSYSGPVRPRSQHIRIAQCNQWRKYNYFLWVGYFSYCISNINTNKFQNPPILSMIFKFNVLKHTRKISNRARKLNCTRSSKCKFSILQLRFDWS